MLPKVYLYAEVEIELKIKYEKGQGALIRRYEVKKRKYHSKNCPQLDFWVAPVQIAQFVSFYPLK